MASVRTDAAGCPEPEQLIANSEVSRRSERKRRDGRLARGKHASTTVRGRTQEKMLTRGNASTVRDDGGNETFGRGAHGNEPVS